jgi:hypothetical protein
MADMMKRAGENHNFDRELIRRVRLAMRHGNYREAEIMIATRLVEDNQGDNAAELRGLLIQVVSYLLETGED